MKHKFKIIFGFLVVILIFLFLFLIFWDGDVETSPLDEFARCLSNKGVMMYGAEWCSHCQNQKKLFGESFRLVSYVECPKDPQRCLEAGIEAYPTWVTADGQKLVGEQKLEVLSQASGCIIEQLNTKN